MRYDRNMARRALSALSVRKKLALVLPAFAAFLVPCGHAFADIINFDPGTYSFDFQDVDAKVWLSKDFTIATSPAGDISNGVVKDSTVQFFYQDVGFAAVASID